MTLAKRKRRWWQFNLKTLLAGTMVVSVVFACLGVNLRRARDQMEAVTAIEKLGGMVNYDYQWDESAGYYDASRQPRGPSWLRKWLGGDFFDSVVAVNMVSGGIGSASGILSLGKATDADLVHVERLRKLKWLSLQRMKVTDDGLMHLNGLTNLESLLLGNTQVGDSGLVHLKKLNNLKQLDLRGTQLTNVGLMHLKGLENLEELFLDNTKVSDAGLPHLIGLSKLRWLSLCDTPVSDAGLVHVKELTNLERLFVTDTRVTNRGVNELRRALPNCQIDYPK